MTKKCIIITTINTPSEQIMYYSTLNDWSLIIVGDSKTNDSLYKNVSCIYLGLKEQEQMYPLLYKRMSRITIYINVVTYSFKSRCLPHLTSGMKITN